jgi:hypothetical protein
MRLPVVFGIASSPAAYGVRIQRSGIKKLVVN